MNVTNDFLEELIRDKAYLPGSAAERRVNEGREEGMQKGAEITIKTEAVKYTIGLLKKFPTAAS